MVCALRGCTYPPIDGCTHERIRRRRAPSAGLQGPIHVARNHTGPAGTHLQVVHNSESMRKSELEGRPDYGKVEALDYNVHIRT